MAAAAESPVTKATTPPTTKAHEAGKAQGAGEAATRHASTKHAGHAGKAAHHRAATTTRAAVRTLSSRLGTARSRPSLAVLAPLAGTSPTADAVPLTDALGLADTQVLGTGSGAATAPEVLPTQTASLVSSVGRYVLPIGIAIGLAFAITGVGALERLRDRRSRGW